MRKIFFHSPIRYLVSVLIGIILALLDVFFDKGFSSIVSYSNGTFISGFMLICIGGLSIVNYFGGFDIFSVMFAKRDQYGHKPTLHEYSVSKAEKRKKYPYVFVPYFTVGAILLIVSAILTIIYSNLI